MDETSAQEDADRPLWLHSLATSLDSYEKWHRKHLSRASSSPYLGHYDLPDALGAYRRAFRGKAFVAVQRMFKRWPALTCILVARCVAKKMGTNTGLEIYPHLAALGSVLDRGFSSVLICDSSFSTEGGLDGKAVLAERRGVGSH